MDSVASTAVETENDGLSLDGADKNVLEKKPMQQAKKNDAKDEKDSEPSALPEFPRPKFVLTIISPDQVTLPPNMIQEDWKQYSTKRTDSELAGTTVQLHLLLVSMLNRLVREKKIPREAVHMEADANTGTTTAHLLLPSTLLPDVISQCERLGVGNLVGMVYASPLETMSMPEPGSHPDPVIVASAIPRDVLSRATSRVSAESGEVGAGGATLQMAPTVVTGTAVAAATGATLITKQETTIPEPPIPPMPTTDGDKMRRHKSNPEDDVWTGNTTDDKISTEEKNAEKKATEQSVGNDTNRSASTVKAVNTTANSTDTSLDDKSSEEEKNRMMAKLAAKVVEARREWLATASRVRVEQVAEEVQSAASLSWDYTLFVLCAAMIAALGLMSDSSVTTLASMLVSPIMGPVMGFTFGTMIRRASLIKTSLRNELLSLFLCLLVGFISGIAASLFRAYEHLNWPTNEMLGRGDATGLIVGVLVALPSGVATALSTLSKNSSGLVGVAISLSLLPPAVNAGICWAYALMLKTSIVDRNEGDNTDYVENGVISFTLTILNIICIWLAGTFTFWMKEVAPIQRQDAFWSRDVIIAREQQDKNLGTDAINAGLQAVNDLRRQKSNDQLPDAAKPIKSLRPRRYSESHLALGNDSRLDELVRARDVLFDDALFGTRELSDRYNEDDLPSLPEDFRSDQQTFIHRIMGAHFYN